MPLVDDVKTFRQKCIEMAKDCVTSFESNKAVEGTYKLLVN